MSVDVDWIEHRRGIDGELLGWLRPEGEGFVVIDLLGRELTGPVDWLEGEELLEAAGIGYLADAYELRLDDAPVTGDDGWGSSRPGWLRVRIVEVSPRGIRLKKDDFGAVVPGAEVMFFEVPFPADERLVPLVRG